MNRDFLPEDRLARQQAADPRFNVALEASAGTGKTSVLVDRYIRLIEEGASPRHILAITFTRKASGEMKSRIIEELRGRDRLWSSVRERLFDIHIATIDAFCLGLLKEFPLEAGLDPDVELLDEVDTQRLTELAVEESLLSFRPTDGPDMGFLISVFGDPALRRSLHDLLRSRLVKEDALRGFVDRFVPRRLDLDSVRRQMVASLNDVLGGRDGVERLVSSGPEPSLPRFRALSLALRRAIDPEQATPLDIEQVASYFLTQDEHRPRQKLSNLFRLSDFPDRAAFESHRDLVLSLAPGVASAYARWFGDRDLYGVRELWRLYHAASKRFRDLKESRRGLDFTDVLLRAVRLLETREEFSQSRFRLESRYHHLLIDEFQDTNEVQWRLIRALIDSWGEGSGLVQATILNEQASGQGTGTLREPSVFIVGDRKQSIYGWRDARVEVLERAARQLLRLRPGGGRRLTIRQSFRAEGTLLDFLNDVFSGVPQSGRELEWSFRYLEGDHFPVLERDEGRRPVGLVVEPDLQRAAAAVADEIVRLLEEEHARPRDLAILFRSRTHYRVYEEALTDRGVPTYVYRGLGFFDSPEVKDVQALVRFLSEPGSELRSAELLRSRFVGLSDVGLALLAAERGRQRREGPFAKLLRGGTAETNLPTLSSADRTLAMRASAKAPDWVRRVDRLPPSDLLLEILEETDYAGWLTGRKGLQGWENLKKILEVVRRAQNRGYLTLSRLAEYLDSASTGEESLAVLEAVDAVNLMTIHAAKGLEFDSVFVVNMGQKTRTDVSLPRIQEKEEGEVEIHALGRPEAEGPARTVEEEKRLLYVALTRARRNLVLCASGPTDGEGKTTFLQLLPEGLGAIFREAQTSVEPEITWTPQRRTHRLRWIRPHSVPRAYRGSREEPHHQSALQPLVDSSAQRVTVSEIVRQQGGGMTEGWDFDPVDASVGTLVHRMFEYSVPLDDSLVEVAESLSAELFDRAPPERAQAASSAAELYRKLRERAEILELLDKGEVHRELPFSLRRRDQIVRGTIDSLVLLEGRVVLIDYKTGAPRPEHRKQMELYLEAARQLFPAREVEGLVFYASGAPYRVPPASRNPQPGSQLKLF